MKTIFDTVPPTKSKPQLPKHLAMFTVSLGSLTQAFQFSYKGIPSVYL